MAISSCSLRLKMAISKSLCLLLCVLALICVSSSLPAQPAKSDFFTLTLTWPGTTCNAATMKQCCMPTTGKPALDFFVESMETYDSYTEEMVTNCNSTCRFAVNQLTNFIEDMFSYWPDLRCPNNNGVNMWRSTFCRYGPCSNLTQQEYFQRALTLRKDLDLLALLGTKGIVPSNTKLYNLEDIESALRTKYPFSFVVQCKLYQFEQIEYQLHKIRYCVSMDGKKFIACPISLETNCGNQVIFPVFNYKMLRNEENEVNAIEMPTKREGTN